MTLNNSYIIKGKQIKEILNELDIIISNIDKFRSRHSGYEYSIRLTNRNNLWDAEINITNEKQIKNRILKKVL